MNSIAVAPLLGAGAEGGTAGVFRYDKSLLSYVFTNPPAHTVLNRHDFVFVLRSSSGRHAESTAGADM